MPPYLWTNGKLALMCVGGCYVAGCPVTDEEGNPSVAGGCFSFDIGYAVDYIAKKVSDSSASDLFEWLEVYVEVAEDLKHQIASYLSGS